MNNKHIYFDGKKSIELSQYPNEAWEWLTGEPDDGKSGIKEYFKAVPWLNRGVTIRGDAVATMPFAIFSGETEIDNSKEYENVVGFLPDPRHTFKLLEMSLSLMGKAYLFNVKNNVVTLDLKYLNPHTMKPLLDEEEGLTGFERTLKKTTKYDVEDIIYFWLEDPYREIGEPDISPAKAALMASGVIANVDEFVAAFFHRGAVKQTLFSAKGMSKSDAEGLESWWVKRMSGVINSWRTKVFNAESMEPTIVGDGIDGLQDTSLTTEKREDISTALGIPNTILFSNAANYATAKQDDRHFYDKTIMPECEFIQSVLNTQVFEPLQLRFEFQPDTLDVFQTEENERAESLGYLTQAGVPVKVAMMILGFELSGDAEALWEEEDKAKEERRQDMMENMQPANPQPPPPGQAPPNSPAQLRTHLEQWQHKSTKRLKAGQSPAVEFESDAIPLTLNAAILGSLEECKTEDDIAHVFVWEGYP